MKVMTILGTRPEIIRLSLIVEKLDRMAHQHTLVHTGQNYTSTLSDLFFEQMKVREPDYRIHLHSHAFGAQAGQMFAEVGEIMEQVRPDRVLVLGDTNSALCAIVAERLGIPVVHMEAGNRCYDRSVPEELNRRMIDSVSSFNLPYTLFSRENLLREGIPSSRIWVSGNPIYEVLHHYRNEIDSSPVLNQLSVEEGNYMVVTAHRAENVDRESSLRQILEALNRIAEIHQIPLICSLHPRTKSRMEQFSIAPRHSLIQLHEPFGFFDFVKLQKHALCVLTDSGTVQEECCILGVPTVTIRNSTERPETIICGSNVLPGVQADRIVQAVDVMLQAPRTWELPEGYGARQVSSRVVNMILGGVRNVQQ